MPVVELRGTSLFYELEGDGEPLLLLNGIMMTTQSWVLQRRALAPHFRLVMHDFRGQMRSAKPPGPYSLETHVDDLVTLLDNLGIESAHVVGTSYGGEIGMLFVATHPERVRTLTVIACVSEVGPELYEHVSVWADAARRTPADFYDITVPYNYSPAFLAARPDIIDMARLRLAAQPPDYFRAFADLIEAFGRLDLTPLLPNITAPTLVIAAGQDIVKPVRYSRLIADRIPNAELVVIPDAGHAVVIEKADEVNAAILRFLGV
jgi:3-oxoadipate enol-lactonase